MASNGTNFTNVSVFSFEWQLERFLYLRTHHCLCRRRIVVAATATAAIAIGSAAAGQVLIEDNYKKQLGN